MRVREILIIGAIPLLALGCGDDAGPVLEEAPAVEEAAEEPGPEEGIRWTEPLEGDAWFAGLRLELTEAELAVDEFGADVLTIRVTVENNTEGNVEYIDPGHFSLAWDDVTAVAGPGSEFEPVPAGGRNRGALVFEVGEDLELADAVLFAGGPDVQRAVLPLGAEGERVEQAPVEVDLAGSATASGLRLDITGGELRAWDETFQQNDAERLTLLLTVDLINESDRAASPAGYDFHLETPDGRTIAAEVGTRRPWEHLFAGEQVRDGELVFTVDDPADGDYAVIVEFEGERAAIEFSL